MNSNISNFRQQFINRNLQLSSRYKVDFFPSRDLEGPRGGLPVMSGVHVETVVIPGRNLEYNLDEIWGPIRKIPVGRTYEYEAVFTIPLKGKWGMKNYFEDWMNALVIKHNNYYSRVEYEGPISDSFVEIIPQTTNDEEASAIILREAYPINILPIEMGHNFQNIYTNLMVLFAFRTYATT